MRDFDRVGIEETTMNPVKKGDKNRRVKHRTTKKPKKNQGGRNDNNSQEDTKTSESLSISSLPPEILTHIFQFLPITNASNIIRVSKLWKEAARDEALWAEYYRKYICSAYDSLQSGVASIAFKQFVANFKSEHGKETLHTLFNNKKLPRNVMTNKRLLNWAIKAGYDQIVRAIFRCADQSAKLFSPHGLILAAAKGHTHVVKALCEIRDFDSINDIYLQASAVLNAAKNGHLKTVKFLLESILEEKVRKNIVNKKHICFSNQKGRQMLYSLTKSDSRNDKSFFEYLSTKQDSALTQADVKLVTLFIKYGAERSRRLDSRIKELEQVQMQKRDEARKQKKQSQKQEQPKGPSSK